MAIEVSTEQYQWAHRDTPRGRGSWGFYMGGSGRWLADPVFAPSQMLYSAAKKWAMQQARAQGFTQIVVAS